MGDMAKIMGKWMRMGISWEYHWNILGFTKKRSTCGFRVGF